MNRLGVGELLETLAVSRRKFIRNAGITLGALPFGGIVRAGADNRGTGRRRQAEPNRVYIARNGDCFQNMDKVLEMMGGISEFINPSDHVVIKGNAQWPHQGYTHTGCIKALIDNILAIPGYSGEIYWDTTKPDGQPKRRLDVSRAKKEFGFEAHMSFREGLKRTIEWYEKHTQDATQSRGSEDHC